MKSYSIDTLNISGGVVQDITVGVQTNIHSVGVNPAAPNIETISVTNGASSMNLPIVDSNLRGNHTASQNEANAQNRDITNQIVLVVDIILRHTDSLTILILTSKYVYRCFPNMFTLRQLLWPSWTSRTMPSQSLLTIEIFGPAFQILVPTVC